MSLAWFICGYKIFSLHGGVNNGRVCAMDDFSPQIIGQDGGGWAETEVLGGYAVVKVSASDATLTTIAGTAGFQRIPAHWALTDTLGDLTNPQKNAILSKLNAMGYTNAEINAALPNNWQNVTLGQVLRFAAQRRLTPRYDDVQQQIVLDGALVGCRPVADVDAAVQ